MTCQVLYSYTGCNPFPFKLIIYLTTYQGANIILGGTHAHYGDMPHPNGREEWGLWGYATHITQCNVQICYLVFSEGGGCVMPDKRCRDYVYVRWARGVREFLYSSKVTEL